MVEPGESQGLTQAAALKGWVNPDHIDLADGIVRMRMIWGYLDFTVNLGPVKTEHCSGVTILRYQEARN